jgi:hypothetical protein
MTTERRMVEQRRAPLRNRAGQSPEWVVLYVWLMVFVSVTSFAVAAGIATMRLMAFLPMA